MYNILIAEDDVSLNRAIGYALDKAGYGVVSAKEIAEAKVRVEHEKIDLILLDVNLPDGEGFSFCHWLKQKKGGLEDIPVIYLTARDLEEDMLNGYESGAEDYVTKPFSMKVLLKKLDVILKRTNIVAKTVFSDGYLSVDIDSAKIVVGGEECALTPTEFRLVRLFLENRGQLLTYDLLLDRLWDSGGQFVDKHTLAVNVNRLRGKIEDNEHKYISNVYGLGYQWVG